MLGRRKCYIYGELSTVRVGRFCNHTADPCPAPTLQMGRLRLREEKQDLPGARTPPCSLHLCVFQPLPIPQCSQLGPLAALGQTQEQASVDANILDS